MTSRYPHLFAATDLGISDLSAQFERLTAPPANIASVNCVPFEGDECLVIVLGGENYDIPGGTLEPDEDYEQAVRRELIEEAGARLLSFQIIGAWKCHSNTPFPFRPHLPHPNFHRLVMAGEIETTGAPQNPADGEQVRRVERFP